MKHIFISLLFAICTLFNYALCAHENDIVINEIMADPSPGIALPEWEYIELYNTSFEAININKWKIIIGKKELSFDGDIVIQSDGYLILCHNDAVEELSSYGDCHGFSSFQITNSGSNISLIDNNDNIMERFNGIKEVEQDCTARIKMIDQDIDCEFHVFRLMKPLLQILEIIQNDKELYNYFNRKLQAIITFNLSLPF